MGPVSIPSSMRWTVAAVVFSPSYGPEDGASGRRAAARMQIPCAERRKRDILGMKQKAEFKSKDEIGRQFAVERTTATAAQSIRNHQIDGMARSKLLERNQRTR